MKFLDFQPVCIQKAPNVDVSLDKNFSDFYQHTFLHRAVITDKILLIGSSLHKYQSLFQKAAASVQCWDKLPPENSLLHTQFEEFDYIFCSWTPHIQKQMDTLQLLLIKKGIFFLVNKNEYSFNLLAVNTEKAFPIHYSLFYEEYV